MPNLLAIDPSSTRTGYAVLGVHGGVLAESGLIPKLHERGDAATWRVLDYRQRAMEMTRRIVEIAVRVAPEHVVIETPALHQHRKVAGRATGLAQYGLAVGMVIGRFQEIEDALTHYVRFWLVGADVWTKTGERTWSTKEDRQKVVMLEHGNRYDASRDRGMDESDAISLAKWASTWVMTEELMPKGVIQA